MKILNNVQEVLSLPKDLSKFISQTSPWIHDNWQAEKIGYIFILNDHDMASARHLNITPHLAPEDSLFIDIETFDLWEFSEHDPESGFWNVVGIVGQEYGFSLYVSDSLVQQLPQFRAYLKGG